MYYLFYVPYAYKLLNLDHITKDIKTSVHIKDGLITELINNHRILSTI